MGRAQQPGHRSLVLASASPARLRTLRGAGLHPSVIVSGVDESSYAALVPEDQAMALARAKAEAVAELSATADSLVVGCDSVLDLHGHALGKPADPDEAVARWRAMRARTGVLVTGHCLIDNRRGVSRDEIARTTVHFAEVSDEEIAAYVATGEPLEVAGAFTVDGLGGAFVTGIEGDHHNVVGISLPLLRTMLADLGVAWTTLWAD
ncbi:MAG: Maf-like protein [Actinomycetota bacterium]|jgi:septum formation protein|nr:Maf-like protein [Actinomycetota bacterium]